MKKYLYTLIALLATGVCLRAQDSRIGRLSFIYIDHSVDAPVGELSKTLKSQYKDARNYGLTVIFYLANMKNSIVSMVSPDEDPDEYDREFGRIIRALQSGNYHDIDAGADVDRIIKIFDDFDFLRSDGSPKYKDMVWSFYVNQNFWDLKYNEKIIGELYWSLDLDRLPEEFLRLKIFYSGNDFVYDKERPFGEKNLCPKLNNMDIIQL